MTKVIRICDKCGKEVPVESMELNKAVHMRDEFDRMYFPDLELCKECKDAVTSATTSAYNDAIRNEEVHFKHWLKNRIHAIVPGYSRVLEIPGNDIALAVTRILEE